MSRPSGPKLFVSYGWKDDQPFVKRLYADLAKLGYDPWMDEQDMPSRGRTLPTEVEEQIELSHRMIAVMGPAAIASEACRAERAFALNIGKVITAILRLGEYKTLPPELSGFFVPDFRANRPYEVALDELHRILRDPPVTPGRLFDVPALPPRLQYRPDELRRLCESLTSQELKEAAVTTSARNVGILGMGGVGKTVIAALVARDYSVRRQFQNGLLWITFGREPNVLTEVQKALTALGDDGGKYNNLPSARIQLGRALQEKECLLILDDVWNVEDTDPFIRAISPRCRLLITTRNQEVVGALGARAFRLDLLTEEQSREFLARQCEVKVEALPLEASGLIHECGRLPLALAMIGAMVRGKPLAFWQHVDKLLRNADLGRIKAQFLGYPYTDLLRAIEVSVDALDAKTRDRYLALAASLDEMSIPPEVQQALWGANEFEALQTAETLKGLSLAQQGAAAGAVGSKASGSIRLHSLQLDFIREQYADQTALALIRGAVRLSSHVIFRKPGEFTSQVVGRLLPHRSHPTILDFMDSLVRSAPRPWLRPLAPALEPPGTGLAASLMGHTGPVSSVAMSTDGRRAVSGSWDGTLKVWNLDSGNELGTLSGHSDQVYCVAVSGDARRAVSGSWDCTVRVWDVDSGRERHTLIGHRASVVGIALTPDGRLAVSASWDGTLKVWDVDGGSELWTLAGHSDKVCGVGVSADGRRAVSASDDGALKVWDLGNGRELQTLRGHTSAVRGVAVSRDGRRAVSASLDATMTVWDVEAGRQLRTLGPALGVGVSADGRYAISFAGDYSLRVWDLNTGKVLRTLAGHLNAIEGVALSADGRRAVSASFDETLRVWDLETSLEPSAVGGHRYSVNGVAAGTNGRRVVSASADKTLKVWDARTGRVLSTLTGHFARSHECGSERGWAAGRLGFQRRDAKAVGPRNKPGVAHALRRLWNPIRCGNERGWTASGICFVRVYCCVGYATWQSITKSWRFEGPPFLRRHEC